MLQRPRGDFRFDGIVKIDFERTFSTARLFQLYDCFFQILRHPVTDRFRSTLRNHQRQNCSAFCFFRFHVQGLYRKFPANENCCSRNCTVGPQRV